MKLKMPNSCGAVKYSNKMYSRRETIWTVVLERESLMISIKHCVDQTSFSSQPGGQGMMKPA